ncbi:hypothetical protein IQ07DRAFT_682749 [Pyrenochaeta sp. DS3sAY3a]|nr:hypothetical protein IQ07DRAFT_682749 [Pyrenochaeta sp. DS3sAY3a]
MTSAEAILQRAADEGSLDSAEWPKTLQYILDRLDEIVSEFPKPPTDPSGTLNTELPSRPQTRNAVSSQESHATDKENAPPATPPRPPVPTFTTSDSNSLPNDITTFYSSIRAALTNNFSKHPPHTIQRLAELILEPKRRYRYLPPYLRALDRVVAVSSPLTVFPLPQAVLPTAGGLLNGTTSVPSSQSSTLGSDESLGGALLTPIPWLQNRGQNELISESTEIVDGPNGAGRIETVTVGMLASNGRPETTQVSQIASSHPEGETLPSTGPVTQGEILRQEQEAGIVLNNPHSMTTSPTRTTIGDVEAGPTILETVEGEEEAPHARGPEVIGLEDTGLQKPGGGLDIEGAVGRPSVERASKSPGPSAPAAEEAKDEVMGDASEKSDAAPNEAAVAEATETAEKPDDVEMKSDA